MIRFRPKLVDALRGYDRAAFAADLGAGITVGVIALPLAIGFGIAAGVSPAQGLWTAIIAGLLVALFGGSRVQIGGPTGAFVPLLAMIALQHGPAGLALATIMAGMVLVVMGALRLGSLIKFIPYPVIAGFTSGIAVIIVIGQLKEFLGLDVALPAHAPQQLATLATALADINWQAVGLGGLALAILILWPRWRAVARVPASLIAVAAPTLLVALTRAPVATIGSKFGGIPGGLPRWVWPTLSFDRLQVLMLPALTIAMLGAIESLLSAIVADGLIEDRHDSNQELIGQGLANIVCPFFGGIAATGAIARTAANVRSGGRTPVAGIVHALTLLVFVLVAAPLAGHIPLAALSAVLFIVAFRMGEWRNFVELARGAKSDFGVLVLTFALTVIFDLTIAVGVGLSLAGLLFVRRMEEITRIHLVTPESDMERGADSIRDKDVPPGVVVYRLEGAFFFGAAEKLETALARYAAQPRLVILRMRQVAMIDATGLRALELVQEKFHRRNVTVILSGVQPQPMKLIFNSGFLDRLGLDNVCPNIDVALARARTLLAPP